MFITSMSIFYQIFDKQSLNYPMLLNLHEVVMSVDWYIYTLYLKMSRPIFTSSFCIWKVIQNINQMLSSINCDWSSHWDSKKSKQTLSETTRWKSIQWMLQAKSRLFDHTNFSPVRWWETKIYCQMMKDFKIVLIEMRRALMVSKRSLKL